MSFVLVLASSVIGLSGCDKKVNSTVEPEATPKVEALSDLRVGPVRRWPRPTGSQLTTGSVSLLGGISGENIAWVSGDKATKTMGVFLCDSQEIIQLNTGLPHAHFPRVSGSRVVWVGLEFSDTGVGSGEIYLYDGEKTIRLTDNDYTEKYLDISGTTVAWVGRDGDNSTANVFVYDVLRGSTTRITNYHDSGHAARPAASSPRVDGSTVVWESNIGWDGEIFIYSDGKVTQLTNNDYEDSSPQVSNGNVVWMAEIGKGWEVFYYDGSTITQLTDDGRLNEYPQVSGSKATWSGYDGQDFEIFFFDGARVTQLTDNEVNDKNPHIDGSNIVWQASDGNDLEIFFHDGEAITQVTDNDYDDGAALISGSTVVWMSEHKDIFTWTAPGQTPNGE